MQDTSCVSSASLGAPESGTLLHADTFDVQASFEVPAHESQCHQGDSAAVHVGAEHLLLAPGEDFGLVPGARFKVDLSGPAALACQDSLINSAPPSDPACLAQLPDLLSPDFVPFSVNASASVVATPSDAPSAAGSGGRRLTAAAGGA